MKMSDWKRGMMLMFKMLRKLENGQVETFYVENYEDKLLLDNIRRKKRMLQYDAEDKNELQQRQKVNRELRNLIVQGKEKGIY